jgi:hypothetical protein
MKEIQNEWEKVLSMQEIVESMGKEKEGGQKISFMSCEIKFCIATDGIEATQNE